MPRPPCASSSTSPRRRRPVVVSSDLSRARETAEIIAAELGTARSARCTPTCASARTARRRASTPQSSSAAGATGTPPRCPAPSRGRTCARAACAHSRRVVRDARRATAPAAASVIVVTHGALIRELIRHATGGELPPAGERLANGSAYTMLYERERLRLLSYAGATA